jgi:SAM-dependent methyltransferase
MIWTIVAQILGFTAGTLLPTYPILVHSLCSGIIAASVRLPTLWIILNFTLPLVLLLPAVNPVIPLIVLVLLLLVFSPVLRTKAPLYLSNELIIEAVSEELSKEDFVLYDLGCGTAKVIRKLAKHFPNGTFYGFELGIIPFIISYLICLPQKNVKIRYKNFWKEDWSKADFLYAFLSPEPMKAVTDKYLALSRKPVFLVNSFPLHIPHQKEVIAGDQILYVYKPK